MENTRPVFFYNFKDSDETFLKLNRDDFNEILSDNLNERQKELINKITDYTFREFGNGSLCTNEGGYESFNFIQCADEYLAMSTVQLSDEARNVVKAAITQHQKDHPANENSTPKKEHTDTPVIGGNGLEVVGKPEQIFHIYDKETKTMLKITGHADGSWQAPEDLKKALGNLSKEDLEDQLSSGKPKRMAHNDFTIIKLSDRYAVFHPDAVSDNPEQKYQQARAIYSRYGGMPSVKQPTKPSEPKEGHVPSKNNSFTL